MNTQTHVLLGAALFARRGLPARSLAAVAGGLMPDLPLYAFFFGARMAGYSDGQIFGDLYGHDWVQTMLGASHSFVIFGVLLAAGLFLWRREGGPIRLFNQREEGGRREEDRRSGFAEVLSVFSAAALVHALTDFPLHNDDAHMQFWPLTRWVFHSPVSYWDSAHHGNYWQPFEALLGIVCAIVLWRRFPQLWARFLCLLAIVMYVAVPAYFIFG